MTINNLSRYVRPPYGGDHQLTIRGKSLPSDYFDVIVLSNGFATDEGFFRFFGIETELGFGNILSQNAAAWITEYGAACSSLIFFAEDVFGDRYAFSFRDTGDAQPSLVKFFCEGGETEGLPFLHLYDFLREAVFCAEPTAFDCKLARAALNAGLRPGLDQHLAFKLPLIASGKYELENLGVEPAQMHLNVVGQITNQIQAARAGAPIDKFKQE